MPKKRLRSGLPKTSKSNLTMAIEKYCESATLTFGSSRVFEPSGLEISTVESCRAGASWDSDKENPSPTTLFALSFRLRLTTFPTRFKSVCEIPARLPYAGGGRCEVFLLQNRRPRAEHASGRRLRLGMITFPTNRPMLAKARKFAGRETAVTAVRRRLPGLLRTQSPEHVKWASASSFRLRPVRHTKKHRAPGRHRDDFSASVHRIILRQCRGGPPCGPGAGPPPGPGRPGPA